jgi:hypothetical protein
VAATILKAAGHVPVDLTWTKQRVDGQPAQLGAAEAHRVRSREPRPDHESSLALAKFRRCRRADLSPENHPAHFVRADCPARAQRLAHDAHRALLASAES